MTNLTKFTISACAAFLLSSTAYSSSDQESFDIGTESVKRMVKMVRDNQFASYNQQQFLIQLAAQAAEKDTDTSGKALGRDLSKRLQSNIQVLEKCEITSQKYEDVGIPIRHHKTLTQLAKAKAWVDAQEDSFSSVHFNYMNLLQELPSAALPQLGSDPYTSFWGNGNDAISGVFLYTIVKYYENKGMLPGVDLSRQSFPGAVTNFPFYNSEFKFQCSDNDFLFSDGMLLAGDYQFGGRRYWSGPLSIGQLDFGPEDCSSAVAKATLDGEEFIHLITSSFRGMYFKPKYGYEAVTTSDDQTLDLGLIKSGDIYVKGNHTAIITSIDKVGKIQTIEFNRDIDSAAVKEGTLNPRLGGGTYSYDLTVTDPKLPIYIFRKPDTQLSESVSLNTLLAQIDAQFKTNHLNDENRPVMMK